MNPILVVSPHLDDAVLSMGQFLAGWPGATVMTVFSGIPEEESVTTFDVNSGFNNSTQAMMARWNEDERALAVLGSNRIHVGAIDNQYRKDDDVVDVDNIIRCIKNAIDSLGITNLVMPLGLAHVDHAITNEACVVIAQNVDIPIWAYEDVPSRVLWPETVVEALDRLKGRKFKPSLSFLGTGPMESKKEAIACYTSQLWALDQNVIFVPERIWKLDKN